MEKEHQGLNTRFKWKTPLKRWRVCYSVLVRQATSARESNKCWPHTQHPTHGSSFVCLLHCRTFFSGFPFRINAQTSNGVVRTSILGFTDRRSAAGCIQTLQCNAMQCVTGIQGTQHWPCSLLYSLHPAALYSVPLMDFLIVRSPPQKLAIKQPAVLPPSEQRLPFSCDY